VTERFAPPEHLKHACERLSSCPVYCEKPSQSQLHCNICNFKTRNICLWCTFATSNPVKICHPNTGRNCWKLHDPSYNHAEAPSSSASDVPSPDVAAPDSSDVITHVTLPDALPAAAVPDTAAAAPANPVIPDASAPEEAEVE
jgi:hypothetical protein